MSTSVKSTQTSEQVEACLASMTELEECGLQPAIISSKELKLVKKVQYRSPHDDGGLKGIDTAQESSPSTTEREDSIRSSCSDPMPSVSEACSAVARRQSFPERREELWSEPGGYKAALKVDKVQSPAMTYKNTNKIAPSEASVLLESVKETTSRAPYQCNDRDSAASDKRSRHSNHNPVKSTGENDHKAGGQLRLHSASLKTVRSTPSEASVLSEQSFTVESVKERKQHTTSRRNSTYNTIKSTGENEHTAGGQLQRHSTSQTLRSTPSEALVLSEKSFIVESVKERKQLTTSRTPSQNIDWDSAASGKRSSNSTHNTVKSTGENDHTAGGHLRRHFSTSLQTLRSTPSDASVLSEQSFTVESVKERKQLTTSSKPSQNDDRDSAASDKRMRNSTYNTVEGTEGNNHTAGGQLRWHSSASLKISRSTPSEASFLSEKSFAAESVKERKQHTTSRTPSQNNDAASDKRRRNSIHNPIKSKGENDHSGLRRHSAPSKTSPVSSSAAFYAKVVDRQSAKCAQQAATRAENSSKSHSVVTAGRRLSLPVAYFGAVEAAMPSAQSSPNLTRNSSASAAEKEIKSGQTRRNSTAVGMPRSGGAAFYSNVVQLASARCASSRRSSLPAASSSQTTEAETQAASTWSLRATSLTSLPAASSERVTKVTEHISHIIASLFGLLCALSLAFQKSLHKCWRLVHPSYTQACIYVLICNSYIKMCIHI